MLHPGLYEQVINRKLSGELAHVEAARKAVAPIDGAEASKVLTQYLSRVVQRALDLVGEDGKSVGDQVALANGIVALVRKATEEADFDDLSVDEHAQQLLLLLKENDPRLALGTSADEVERPETSLSQSSLFTGAVHEPQMFSELKKEIAGADRIDMLVSFIKWSGLRLIMDDLTAFTQNGGVLRVITTSYMGATDVKAIEELSKLPNTTVKVSYDTKRTRLHAKAYVFYRNTGFTTAYVGSSNLSNAAISSGLEWNVKVTRKDLPETVKKITATFDSYWNAHEFELYGEGQRERLHRALRAERFVGDGANRTFVFDIHPYPYQQEILDALHAEREVRGKYRNLVVAATGTGKTVISAFDYRRFCRANPGKPNRLLFVAHREEILRQSRDTFQGVLKDPNFGELFVGSWQPESLDHLFVSIQTVNARGLCDELDAEYYDYIVVDEFHHAAAPTYRRLLSHFRPKLLLGLTATPERLDGRTDVLLSYFDNRIAAEIRLPEAIDRKLLCPFQYFGVSDTADLNELRWVRGGYDRHELSNLYTLNRAVAEKRAAHIVRSVEKYAADMAEVKGLGFCVSVEHAHFMAEYMSECGIPSIALDGNTADDVRRKAKERLVSGELTFIFVVDLYNEGVDIPEVNTVLFLRPTESLTVFLQQLGRGLRLAEGKECLTVLDFIGRANAKYNFEDKFAALLSGSRHSVRKELENGFVSTPKGCYIQLEKKARQVILDNIKKSFGVRGGLVSRVASFEEDSGLPLTLANFLSYYHLDKHVIYTGKLSFSRLCVLAGVRPDFTEEAEEVLTKAFARLHAIDSRRWIRFLLTLLESGSVPDPSSLSEAEERMLRMFGVTVWGESADIRQRLGELMRSPVLRAELMELLAYNLDHIDFIDEPVALGFDCPLCLHCTYTRDQLLMALDYLTPSNVREGVKWLPDKGLDVFFVTLNKSDKDYSPTTMYNDYSINETLFHWQSQSTTAETSATGQRYIRHKERGSKVLLFVREFKTDASGASPYTFLGLAEYVTHEGSKPMNVTWRLDRPIPAKFLKKTNKLVVG